MIIYDFQLYARETPTTPGSGSHSIKPIASPLPTLPSRAEVMRVYTGIDINSGLLDETKSERDGLDLTTTATVKVFPPGQICGKILDSIKKQVYFTPKRNKYRYRRSSRDDRLHGRYVGEVGGIQGAGRVGGSSRDLSI